MGQVLLDLLYNGIIAGLEISPCWNWFSDASSDVSTVRDF